jgi:hypothetical protein
MRWNVWIYDVPRGRWFGCVHGKDEADARCVAILQLDIPAGVRFHVSPR